MVSEEVAIGAAYDRSMLSDIESGHDAELTETHLCTISGLAQALFKLTDCRFIHIRQYTTFFRKRL